MSLQDFATLALAQAYEENTYLDVEGGWLGQYFSIVGIADTIKGAQSNTNSITLLAGAPTTIGQIATYMVETVTSDGEFSIDPSKTKGEYFRLILEELKDRSLLTQIQLDFILSGHTITTKPYESATQAEFDEAKDAGETITLPANTGEHKVTLSITKTPSKLTKITIQQRFGDTPEDLTEWHDVASVNVLYKQKTYSSGVIPASGSLRREMRLISPLSLGVSKV